MDYREAKQSHENLIFEKFNNDPTFLFLNQFMKNGNKELQKQFLRYINFNPTENKIDTKFNETYNFVKANDLLPQVIQFIIDNRSISIWFNSQETTQLLQDLSTLDLVQDEFSPTTSIDKQLFAKVQKSERFQDLQRIIDEMDSMLEKKIYWTYYNTQTTRIIEDIFNQHNKVIPTLVDIKGVDFFINNIPLDLKITRIPKGFNESFNKNILIKWLYENQSEQRFGAENRLFLILNDKLSPENSDKLKILEYNLIKDTINNYLDKFINENLQDVTFMFGNKSYNVKSDIIFINV